jgi:hypothetical protein
MKSRVVSVCTARPPHGRITTKRLEEQILGPTGFGTATVQGVAALSTRGKNPLRRHSGGHGS